MYPSTEDLLKIRDGELVDAKVRAAVDADPSLRSEVKRLQATRKALQSLPEIEPPPDVWGKIEAETGSPTPKFVNWPVGGAIAATVAVVALLFVARPDEGQLPSTTVVERPVQTISSGLTNTLVTPEYASLVEESARLEQLLNGITYQPRMINVGTATTIAGLEDRLAVVDEGLMYASAYGLDPYQRQALWRERVDLMNALLQVRYAQLQRFGN